MVYIDTFRAAEAAYNSITPLRGAQNADKDIRPLGQRRRKHERIVKISRNCYALTCGWHPGEENWARWYACGSYVPTLKDMAKYAPIVWRKHKDGTETITVRNGIGGGIHTSWYEFLRVYLPWSLSFDLKGGLQYIVANDVPHYLPKGLTVPKVAAVGMPAYRREKYQTTEDHAALTFKMQDGKVCGLVGGAQAAPKPPKRRVNKALKAELKPHIDAFRDWAMAITPMLPRDTDYYKDVVHDANRYLRDQGHGGSMGSIYWAFGDRNFELARSVVADDEHPLRILLGLSMRYRIERKLDASATPSEFKAAYNNWANKVFDLVQKVEGETE
jgi:hypothetical protein